MKNLQDIKKHLLLDLIPFWFGMADVEYGGYYGKVDINHNVIKDADKGCILNSRILWFFSSVSYMTKEGKMSENDFSRFDYTSSEVLEAAHHAYEFFRNYFYDEVDGGVYWSVTYDGRPVDKTKHTYNMAFALNALSAYYRVTGSEEVLEIAYDIYATLEQCKDEDGYFEEFKKDFSYTANDKLSEKGVLADRTLNSLLHIMEAYAGFYNETQDEEVRGQLINVMNIIADKMYDPNTQSLKLFFDFDYKPLVDLDSYGHEAMFTWDLIKTMEIIGDDDLTDRMVPIAFALLEHVYSEGFDGNSVAFEKENGIIDQTREWWVQAESMILFVYAYLYIDDAKFIEAANKQWEFIWNHQIDRRVRPSEWYPKVTQDGTPIAVDNLIDEWKCPYHAGRMCMEIIKRSDELEEVL